MLFLGEGRGGRVRENSPLTGSFGGDNFRRKLSPKGRPARRPVQQPREKQSTAESRPCFRLEAASLRQFWAGGVGVGRAFSPFFGTAVENIRKMRQEFTSFRRGGA